LDEGQLRVLFEARAIQEIGRTDDIGRAVVDEPVHVRDFHATILHLFGLDHLKLKVRFNGLDVRHTNLAGESSRNC
jgi:uncharacterized protein DUF1501